jgi:hypothetical protein
MAYGYELDVTVLDEKNIDRAMFGIGQILEPASLATFLRTGAEPILQGRASARFMAEGDDVSGPWAPLKSSTQAVRASQGYGPDHPINHRTGALEHWITRDPGDLVITPFEVDLLTPSEGTSKLKKKLETAQSGSTSPDTVPRPVLGFSEVDFIQIVMAFGGWVHDRMAAIT